MSNTSLLSVCSDEDEVYTSNLCLGPDPPECCFPVAEPALITGAAIHFILVAIVGAIGNGLTLVAIPYARRRCRDSYSPLRSYATVLLLNLSLVDFIFCAVFLPLVAMTFLMRGWPFGPTSCYLSACLRHIIGQVSPNTIAAMSMNRAMALWWPSAYRFVFESLRGIPAIAAIWLVSIGFNLPIALGFQGTFGYSYKSGQCMTLHVQNQQPNLVVGVYLLLPGAVTLISLVLMGIKLHQSWADLRSFTGISSTTKKQLKMRENRVALVFFLLGAIHFVCDGPLTVAYFCCWDGSWPSPFWPAVLLASLTFALNFFVYALRISCYREAYSLFLGSVWRWIKRLCGADDDITLNRSVSTSTSI